MARLRRSGGAYTAAELKQIDAYAAALSIEVVPCIQTLGHLDKLLPKLHKDGHKVPLVVKLVVSKGGSQ